jgi:hypothetical protein
VGQAGGAQPLGVAPCRVPRPGARRLEPGRLRGAPARRVRRKSNVPPDFTAAADRAKSLP